MVSTPNYENSTITWQYGIFDVLITEENRQKRTLRIYDK